MYILFIYTYCTCLSHQKHRVSCLFSLDCCFTRLKPCQNPPTGNLHHGMMTFSVHGPLPGDVIVAIISVAVGYWWSLGLPLLGFHPIFHRDLSAWVMAVMFAVHTQRLQWRPVDIPFVAVMSCALSCC